MAKAIFRKLWIILAILLLAMAVAWAIPSWRPFARNAVPFVGSAGFLLLVATCVLILPSFLVSHDIGSQTIGSDFTVANRLEAINNVRSTLINGIGGALVLVGIFFTWQQLRVDKEGDITDRFTNAVEQLGNESSDVRLGGVYALERMARDSEKDRKQIAEILASYITAHSPWPLPQEDNGNNPDSATKSAKGSSSNTGTTRPTTSDEDASLAERAPDIQAALTVLGRNGYFSRVTNPLLVQNVNVRHADMFELDFWGAYFGGSNFTGAILIGTRLDEARLFSVQFDNANLFHTSFDGAKLCGADFSTAENLDEAYLRGARADESTVWPRGFDWKAAGVEEHPEESC
jgi:hypothetical protein